MSRRTIACNAQRSAPSKRSRRPCRSKDGNKTHQLGNQAFRQQAEQFLKNADASFTAAHAIAKAQSLPEALQLHTELFQKLAAQTAEQTKEYLDLSTRATQHVFEQMQVVAAKSMKPTA